MTREGVRLRASEFQQLEVLNPATDQIVAKVKNFRSIVDSGGGAGYIAANGIEGPASIAGMVAAGGAEKAAVHSKEV